MMFKAARGVHLIAPVMPIEAQRKLGVSIRILAEQNQRSSHEADFIH